MKKCSTCKTIKELSKFHVRNTSSDGLTSQCKLCRKIYSKKRYHQKKGASDGPLPGQTEFDF